jgi:hypothetical protein
MRINTNHSTPPVEQAEGPQKAAMPRLAEQDRADFRAAESLRDSLDTIPDVCSAVVARARTLAEDTNYPAPEVIRRIATLLALGLEESE